MKSSISVNCPWASCRIAPFHFRQPIWGIGVQPPRMCSPSSPTWAPSKRSACSGRDLPSRWTIVGLSTLQPWGSHSLLTAIYSLVLSSLHKHMLGPGLLILEMKGSAFLVQVSAENTVVLRPLPRSSPRYPLQPSLWLHPDCNVPGAPHLMLHTQAVGMKSLQAAEQPAHLAPVRFNCWQSTGVFGSCHIITKY